MSSKSNAATACPTGWSTKDWTFVMVNTHLNANEIQPLLDTWHDGSDVGRVLKEIRADKAHAVPARPSWMAGNPF